MKQKHIAKGQQPKPLGPEARRFGLELPAEAEALPILGAFAVAISLEADFGERARNHIQIALEEIAVNILMHGSGPGSTFQVYGIIAPGQIRWEILDHGQPFAFEAAAAQYSGTPDLDQEVGGIGLYLLKKVMDEVYYEPATPQGNRLTLVKYKEQA